MRCSQLTLVVALALMPLPIPAWRQVDAVRIWARNLGDELWRLSEALTKSDQIRIKYKQMNASVKQKNGGQILDSSLQSVSTMLTRKINAVKCIHATAEELARDYDYSAYNGSDDEYQFQYCSAKYSKFVYEDKSESDIDDPPAFVEDNMDHYMDIRLEKDSHFYDINVSTNTSCVHVPTNIYFKERDALNAILWSKKLDDVFIRNYQADPSLSWQYFGSSHGIMRFYPGMPWNKQKTDTYDCRVRPWYIEAATCSKEVVILFDVSGSMTGFKNYVARRTLKALLDTLSNNDYVNVYTFKNETKQVVSCFEDLVQATRENLESILDTLEPTDKGRKHKVPLDGNANLTLAYMTAFKVLKERRSGCDVSSTQGCNQLVMVITDYVPGNLTEVFEDYNRETVHNNTYIPVRVFTYLIGKEVTNVQEIQWMACLNRGYFVHIHSVEEVQQQVLKYINVIARPMILAKKEPPPTWTHANIDFTRTEWKVSGDLDKPDEDKLVTSVAIPAFDYVYNENHKDAILLGVAGTDVPIDNIAKLAQPHQLGVNGYSFIVSNNGYLLLHPLLIATINNKLQKNYNSVDFVEVEQVDDGKGPRELGPEIQMLRQKLVEGKNGNMPGINVLYHYDKLRRIAQVQHDYFFNELTGTPFSMGISLPRGYGNTELLLRDNPLEAKQGKDVTGINVTDYFRFSYRIHPDWVYCKYHYLEGHETPNPEVEIWNFLVNISKNELDITQQQYTEEIETVFNVTTHCGDDDRTGKGKEDYYCNEDLVKQLVFDAKLTSPYFDKWLASHEEKQLASTYNVSVRFIATGSGLTRWHYIADEDKNEKVDDFGNREKTYSGSVFGDEYHNSIEETWYKAAVLQHMINKESLVVATPLPILDDEILKKDRVVNDDGDITITATYAIFYKDGDSETPASVVGFQYSYLKYFDRFKEITNKSKDLSCDGEHFDCYIIDSSGYVVLSVDMSDVGQFFGVMEPYVLQSFMDKNIFKHVEVFNYQALCPLSMLATAPDSAWSLSTPFNIVSNFMRWLLLEAIFIMNDLYNGGAYAAYIVSDDEDDVDYDELIKQVHTEASTTPLPKTEDNETIPTKKEKEGEPFSCDHRIRLYILNQNHTLNGVTPVVFSDEAGECHPPYWASYMPRTNLLLVVVQRESGREWQFPESCEKPPDTKPEPTEDSARSRDPCHKLDLGQLTRRRLEGCFTYHEEERNITECGHGTMARADIILFITTTALATLASRLLC